MVRNIFAGALKAGMTGLLFSGLLLGLVSPMFAARAQVGGEETWSPQTSGTTRRLFSVFFFDAAKGWAVGEGGTMVRTTNGGASWTVQDSGIIYNLRSVFFLSPTNGWVAGDSGYVARSSDGGLTWNKLDVGTSAHLNAVRFKDINMGWAVGDAGAILETTDGGTTWQRKASGTNNSLRSLVFLDAQTYWAAGDAGTFVRTEDGGASWVSQPAIATTVNLSSVIFTSQGTGYAVGAGGVLVVSADRGKNWTRIVLTIAQNFHSIAFADAGNGWIAADNGTMLVTRDGGRSWDVRLLGTSNRVSSLYFVDRRNGWAVGDSGSVFKYSLVERVGPTDTSLVQDINDDGRVVMFWRIDRVKDLVTGQPRQALRGIAEVKAAMNFEEGFTAQDFRALAPFDRADVRVNNTGGIVSFEGITRETEPQAPLVLARFFPRLGASTARTVNVSLAFSSIVEGSGSTILPTAPNSLKFLRGDAKADGAINADDSIIIARFVTGQAKKDELNLLNAASVYPDGPDGDRITIKDAMFLAQKLAGVRNDEFRPASGFWADALAR
ncbi:MAG: hypothetical protein HY673_19930 [Chloroflexi bacterium]|nr:hypothetical protein [Chloroflexota bacterium]